MPPIGPSYVTILYMKEKFEIKLNLKLNKNMIQMKQYSYDSNKTKYKYYTIIKIIKVLNKYNIKQ